jgi:hypothetical protein
LFRFILAPTSEEPDISESFGVGIVSRCFLNCIERTRNKIVCKAFRDSVEGGIHDAHLWWIGHLKGPAARHSACRGFDRMGRVTSPGLLDPTKSIRVADKGARKAIYTHATELPSRLATHLCAFTGSERPAVLLAFGFIPLNFFRSLPSPIHASLFLSDHALTALERLVPAGTFEEARFASFVANQTTPQHALNHALWALYDQGLLHEKGDHHHRQEDVAEKEDEDAVDEVADHDEAGLLVCPTTTCSSLAATAPPTPPTATTTTTTTTTTIAATTTVPAAAAAVPPSPFFFRPPTIGPLAPLPSSQQQRGPGGSPLAPLIYPGSDPNMARFVRARDVASRPKPKRPPSSYGSSSSSSSSSSRSYSSFSSSSIFPSSSFQTSAAVQAARRDRQFSIQHQAGSATLQRSSLSSSKPVISRAIDVGLGPGAFVMVNMGGSEDGSGNEKRETKGFKFWRGGGSDDSGGGGGSGNDDKANDNNSDDDGIVAVWGDGGGGGSSSSGGGGGGGNGHDGSSGDNEDGGVWRRGVVATVFSTGLLVRVEIPDAAAAAGGGGIASSFFKMELLHMSEVPSRVRFDRERQSQCEPPTTTDSSPSPSSSSSSSSSSSAALSSASSSTSSSSSLSSAVSSSSSLSSLPPHLGVGVAMEAAAAAVWPNFRNRSSLESFYHEDSSDDDDESRVQVVGPFLGGLVTRRGGGCLGTEGPGLTVVMDRRRALLHGQKRANASRGDDPERHTHRKRVIPRDFRQSALHNPETLKDETWLTAEAL